MSLRFLSVFYFVLSISVFTASASDDDNLIVKLKDGKSLKGILQHSEYSKKEYTEFRGIPFANPPVGELRFKAPVKYDGVWSEAGARDATAYGSICYQINAMDMNDDGEIVIGDEDCLFLNVATPNPKTKKKYPVAVWIHGGSFQFENGDAYGPQKFMEHPLIVVTFNYRLSVFGFLNSEDGLIQGNMGLKDQVLALKWVQENIESFGGDKNQVTIFGANAGAVSTHLHLLSDMSKGLFQRAISQSGSAIAPWVLTRSPAKRVEKLVKLLQCGNDTLGDYDCLMKADAKKIVTNTQGFAEWYIDPLVPTGPSIELMGSEPKFLTQNPYAIIKSGEFHGKNIPWIIGVNSHEGLLHSVDIANHGILKRVFNWEWSKAAPITLVYKATAIDHQSVSDNVWKFYFVKDDEKKTSNDEDEETTIETETEADVIDTANDDQPKVDVELKDDVTVDSKDEKVENDSEPDSSNDETKKTESENKEESEFDADMPDIDKLEKPDFMNQLRPPSEKNSDLFVDKDSRMDEMTNMYSDRYFFHPIHHTGRLHVKFGGKNPAPLYLYYFEYSGKQSIVQFSGHTDRNYGVSHFDQIQYMFKTPYFNETEGEDTEFGRRYVKGIAKFIIEGSPPSPLWKPLTMAMADGDSPLLYNRVVASESEVGENLVMEEPFTERIQFWDKQLILEMEKENMVDSMAVPEIPETVADAVAEGETTKGKDEL